ncbi:hypothetical protein FDB44_17315 [Clostridium botulinum]|uniref:Uncharacterized protein n=1 Tax=Clostridium botulinum TaxID=1491 RepID=A0A9Q4TKM9_CLOBO|nr:hypothetical protein [Clostridium botulinum]MBY6935734.1 hypothetical protein [Clostridium botulinum]NFL84691.1 hypothetical protein [Clostridium botulinum]NFN13294.1 hypothetical protein [Clostridium botulinum]NFO38457.1 hypothetical protein [Clostridium botulinum]NFO65313.1 hypothetical protein [Clostridium botulinum]
MDNEISTSVTEVSNDIDNSSSNSSAEAHTSVDLSPIIDRLDVQNNYLIVGDIILIAILVFLAFKNMLRGLFH